MTDNRKWRPKQYMYVPVCILPISTDILTFTMNESSADILWRNRSTLQCSKTIMQHFTATSYQLCAVDDDLLLLPVLSIILKMYNYHCLYSAQSFSISNIQKYHICEVYICASYANNYISGNMTVSIEIPTPNSGFLMMTSSTKD